MSKKDKSAKKATTDLTDEVVQTTSSDSSPKVPKHVLDQAKAKTSTLLLGYKLIIPLSESLADQFAKDAKIDVIETDESKYVGHTLTSGTSLEEVTAISNYLIVFAGRALFGYLSSTQQQPLIYLV